MRTLSTVAATALILASACAPEPEPPLVLKAGVHRVRLSLPSQWRHYDRGDEHRFEDDRVRVLLSDLGPVTHEGFRREVDHARELYRRGQTLDARTHLAGLDLDRAVPTRLGWASIRDEWRIVRYGGSGTVPAGPDTVERAYASLLAEIASVPAFDLATIVRSVLPEIGHGEQREIADEQAMAIGGLPALRIDSWDRLSHAQHRRHVFVLNEGNLLVVQMELGDFSRMEPGFDALVASLELVPDQDGP